MSVAPFLSVPLLLCYFQYHTILFLTVKHIRINFFKSYCFVFFSEEKNIFPQIICPLYCVFKVKFGIVDSLRLSYFF